MRKAFLFTSYFCFLSIVFSQESTKKISGTVTDGTNPVANVNVLAKGGNNGVSTDSIGNFEILANIKDMLSFSHLGMVTEEVRVKRKTEYLDIVLQPAAEELDEVVLKKRKRKTNQELELEYETNKELIRSAYGILDKRKTGQSIRIIDAEDFNPGQTFIDAIQGKFLGRVTYPRGSKFIDPKIYLRERPTLSGGSQAAIYDVDGAITSDAPVSIPISDIKRIGIIRGMGAVSRYGSNAAGGVIIINTKRGKRPISDLGTKYKSLADFRSAYPEDDFCEEMTNPETPIGFRELMDSDTEEEALETAKKIRRERTISPYDEIELGNYFAKHWQNDIKANEIWSSLKKKYTSDIQILKALAYRFEENDDLPSALGIYQRIASLRPNDAQSFRDLAYMYSKSDKPNIGLKIYTQYLQKTLNPPQEISDGIDFMMRIEALNIAKRSNTKIEDKEGVMQQILNDATSRLVLEWNRPGVEFDVHWENDDNQYYVWGHTTTNNVLQLEDEKKKGYYSKQFFTSENVNDAWTIRLKHIENKSSDPTYVKATLYQNYGTAAQREKIKVFRLSEENSCLTLF